eukprot:g2942.t1
MKRIGTFLATVALLIFSCEAILYFKVKCERPTYGLFYYNAKGCKGEEKATYGFENKECIKTPDSIIYEAEKMEVSEDGNITLSYYDDKTCTTKSRSESLKLNTCEDSVILKRSEIVRKMSVPLATYEIEDSDCEGDYTGIFVTRSANDKCANDRIITCSDDLKTYRIQSFKADSDCEGKPDFDVSDLKVDKCYDSTTVGSASALSVVSSFIVVVCALVFL